MWCLCQKCKKWGVTDFVSEIKSEENSPYFEKLTHEIQNGLLSLKISKVSQRRQTILVIFSTSGSVVFIILNATNI